VQEGTKKKGEGRRYMNTADKMSMEGGQRLDAWTGNGRKFFTENVSLLKEAEEKVQAKVIFGCIS